MSNLRDELKSKLDELKIELQSITNDIDISRREDQEEDVAVTRDLLDQKTMLIQQIADIEDDLDTYRENNTTSIVDMGNAVSLEIGGLTKEITIVPSAQADPSRGYISSGSPLGIALVGKKKGETILLETPAGRQFYQIVEIK
ncbi:GreA/GreB family elongation factor [Candidatus Dojkabacteria bacterium]|nr:GreA/GreB family elongation factor [Candidatus Dojkabacteria bacterium]